MSSRSTKLRMITTVQCVIGSQVELGVFPCPIENSGFVLGLRRNVQGFCNFNDWYAFEILPQHLEYEALQTYERWKEGHQRQLREVKQYWKARDEIISTLKDVWLPP